MIKFVKSEGDLPPDAVHVSSGEYSAVVGAVLGAVDEVKLLEAVEVLAKDDVLTWRRLVPLGVWLEEVREGDRSFDGDILALIRSGSAPDGYEGASVLTEDDRCRFLGALLKRAKWDGSVAIVGVWETRRELDTDPKASFYNTLRGALRACWNAGVDVWVVGTWLEEVLERDPRFFPFLERP